VSALNFTFTAGWAKLATFGKSGGKPDKTTIVYNSHVTLTGIPLEAYDYIVNGKPALEWIIERYAVTVDKDSGIRNDPNDWSDDLLTRDTVGSPARVSGTILMTGQTTRNILSIWSSALCG